MITFYVDHLNNNVGTLFHELRCFCDEIPTFSKILLFELHVGVIALIFAVL